MKIVLFILLLFAFCFAQDTTWVHNAPFTDNAANTIVTNNGLGAAWTSNPNTSTIYSANQGGSFLLNANNDYARSNDTWAHTQIIFDFNLVQTRQTAATSEIWGMVGDGDVTPENGEVWIRRLGGVDDFNILVKMNDSTRVYTVTGSDPFPALKRYTIVLDVSASTWVIACYENDVLLSGSWDKGFTGISAGIIKGQVWAGSNSTSEPDGYFKDFRVGYTTTQYYYVNQSGGADAKHGASQDSAWSTIAKVNGVTLFPNTQVLFKRGEEWREQLTVPSSGTSGNQITFGAYGTGAMPIIDGADLATTWVISSVANIYRFACTWNAGVVQEDNTPLNYIAWNTNLATTAAAMSAGSFSLDNSNDSLYVWASDSTDPDTHVMEVSTRQFSVYMTGKDYINMNNIIVEGAARVGIKLINSDNNKFSNMTFRWLGGEENTLVGNGIEFADHCDNDTVNNSMFYEIWDAGISPQPASGADSGRVSGIVADTDTMYNCGRAGVEIRIVNDTTLIGTKIMNSLIYDTGLGWSGGRGGDGILVTIGSSTGNITGTIIQDTEIYGSTAKGIELINAGDVTMDRCYIHDNTTNGIYLAAAVDSLTSGITLRTSIIEDNGAEGLLWAISGTSNEGFTLYNNDFYSNTGSNFEMGQYGAGTPGFIKNNIFYADNDYAALFRSDFTGADSVDYNIYYRASGNMIKWGGVDYTLATWATYQSASSQDANSPTAQDPLFTDAANNNFIPLGSSPALNAGVSVSLTLDYAGNAVASIPDIGAYEFSLGYEKRFPKFSDFWRFKRY